MSESVPGIYLKSFTIFSIRLKGHQRFRSDEGCNLTDFQNFCDDKSKETSSDFSKSFLKVPLGTFSLENRSGSTSSLKLMSVLSSTITNGDSKKVSASLVSHVEILERFRNALEHYGRFSFTAYVEYECTMRAVSIFVFHRLYNETEVLLKKFLSSNFSHFYAIEWENFLMINFIYLII